MSEAYRLKVVRVRPELIVGWLRTGRIPEMVLLTEKLPEDARVVAGDFDLRNGMFVLVVESEEFDLVPARLCRIPELETPVWGVKQEACDDDPDSRKNAAQASSRLGTRGDA